ncbi:hypothetical protein FPZ12_039705 [Amycolatopsis acidicola]|uniref:Uncharacterized protein n=1 Tax=Amycolatopsis acidicola TaxID=2596893 RepID=A0A5N0URE4_9PSEU|nr:hypothetical protein FPZ12_039705 [Amycolatopsis acidicola]
MLRRPAAVPVQGLRRDAGLGELDGTDPDEDDYRARVEKADLPAHVRTVDRPELDPAAAAAAGHPVLPVVGVVARDFVVRHHETGDGVARRVPGGFSFVAREMSAPTTTAPAGALGYVAG